MITFLLLLLNIVNPIFANKVIAQEEPEIPAYEPPENQKLIYRILRLLGNLTTNLAPNVKPFLVSAGAKPALIEIGYNETVNLEIGMIDINTSDFEIPKEPVLYKSRYVKFEVIEYPVDISKNSWYINYEPDTVDVTLGSPVKTNVTISLTSPPVADNAIQSGVLKFRLTDVWALRNLWWPPEGFPGYETFPYKLIWLFSAIFILRYGKYSGTIDVQTQDVDVLVKVKPYHKVKIETIPLITIEPDEIASIPITIQNLGNYNDTYGFRIVSKHENILLSEPAGITLSPGEVKDTYLPVSVPPNILDYGTLHEVKVEVYSISEPNITIADRDLTLQTKGVFISQASIAGAFILLIFVILIIALLIMGRKYLPKDIFTKIKKSRKKKILKKPVKKEKQRKKEDKKKKEKIKEAEKKKKEEKEETLKPVEKKSEIKREERTQKKTRSEKQKERVLSKIKNQQKKQKKKFGYYKDKGR